MSTFLISSLLQSIPGKVTLSNGKVLIVPGKIVIKNNLTRNIFIKEKSEPKPALTPEQEVACARMCALFPNAVFPAEKVSGELLEPGSSKELIVNSKKDEQPLKVIPTDLNGSEYTVIFPTYWLKEVNSADQSEINVFTYLASDIVENTIDSDGFTKCIEKK